MLVKGSTAITGPEGIINSGLAGPALLGLAPVFQTGDSVRASATKAIAATAAPPGQSSRLARCFSDTGLPTCHRYTRTGLGMFLTLCTPIDLKEMGSLPSTWSNTVPEMHSPPGWESSCSRAATFTPSP